jgi:transcriptional regulator with XRE-family HTH domain
MQMGTHSTLATVLVHHIEEARTCTRKQIEFAAGVTHSTVGRWMAEEQPTYPTVDQMQLMLSAGRLPRAIQIDLLEWLLGHSIFAAVPRLALDREQLDANHDGRITASDAVRHALDAQARSVELLQTLTRAIDGGRITLTELQRVSSSVAELRMRLDLALEAARRDAEGRQ